MGSAREGSCELLGAVKGSGEGSGGLEKALHGPGGRRVLRRWPRRAPEDLAQFWQSDSFGGLRRAQGDRRAAEASRGAPGGFGS
eukprot:9562880-Alexandrium_andersonii.AAC.1